MIDPVTAMAAATAAYRGIKKAVEVSKSISEMSGTIAKFAKAASDIDFLDAKAKNPSVFKMFGDHEANALEIWSKKQKLAEWREELRTHISWHYGPKSWDEIVKIEGSQRKRQQEMVYKREEFISACISWGIGIAILLIGIGGLVAVMYLLGGKF